MSDDERVLDWSLLSGFEGGRVEFADGDAEFWLRSDFRQLADFGHDVDGLGLECVRFASAAERRRYAVEKGLAHFWPEVAVYAVDVGSVRAGNFAFWRHPAVEAPFASPDALVDLVVVDLVTRRRVSLGFEFPASLPLPASSVGLGVARAGEGNRAWSASAGSGALATGVQQALWLLEQVRQRISQRFAATPSATFSWPMLMRGDAGLHLWEAFVTRQGPRLSSTRHVDDALASVHELVWRASQLADGEELPSDVETTPGLNLIGAALLRAGWSGGLALLSDRITVVRPRN